MTMGAVEAMLRGGAVALFLLLAWRFAHDARASLTARLGLWMAIGGAAYVALMIVDVELATPGLRTPLHLISLSTPAVFWLFASSWFDDEFELHWYHIGFVVLVTAAGVVANYLFSITGNRVFLLGIAWRTLSLVAVALGVRAALRGWRTDLVEQRRRLRLILAGTVALLIAWIVLNEVRLTRWPPPESWRIVNAAVLMAVAAAIAGALLGWRDQTLMAAPAPALRTAPRVEADDSALLVRLDVEMRRELLWRQEGVTITALAARLGVPEYRLRRAINQGLGARNFAAFLNRFRIDEARMALADPGQREVPILTIALDAGFGSLAPFNRAFREREGCTPSEYRARASSDSQIR